MSSHRCPVCHHWCRPTPVEKIVNLLKNHTTYRDAISIKEIAKALNVSPASAIAYISHARRAGHPIFNIFKQGYWYEIDTSSPSEEGEAAPE